MANVWVNQAKIVELLYHLKDEIAKIPEGERDQALHQELDRALQELSW